jgi:hypothetical protein
MLKMFSCSSLNKQGYNDLELGVEETNNYTELGFESLVNYSENNLSNIKTKNNKIKFTSILYIILLLILLIYLAIFIQNLSRN